MTESKIQQNLFLLIKDLVPPHISMVDSIGELLNISDDSVYRRIRGIKPLTLDELKLLCEHFNISPDQVFDLKNDHVLFKASDLNSTVGQFSDYLNGLLQQFKYFNSFKSRKMYNLCKDVMLWDFYMFPEIAAFKTFFWAKTIHNDPSLNGKQFSLIDDPFTNCYSIGQEILKEFNKIPTVDLWNLESINSTINQITYYKESGMFRSNNDFIAVVDSLAEMLDHLQLQVEKGVKFIPGESDYTLKAPTEFYINELILGNNTYLLELDGQRISAITYGVLSFMITRDPRFSVKAFESFNALLARATRVSGSGERERNKFFNAYKEKVQKLKA